MRDVSSACPSSREFEFDEEGQVVRRNMRMREAGDFVLLQPGHVEWTEDPHDGHARFRKEDVVEHAFEVETAVQLDQSLVQSCSE